MRWIQADRRHYPVHDKPVYVKVHGLPRVGFAVAGRYFFDINDAQYPYDKVQYLDESAPSEMEELLWKELEDWFKLSGAPVTGWETYKQSLIDKLKK